MNHKGTLLQVRDGLKNIIVLTEKDPRDAVIKNQAKQALAQINQILGGDE